MAALAVYYAYSTTVVQSKAIMHDTVNSQNNLSIAKSLHGRKGGEETHCGNISFIHFRAMEVEMSGADTVLHGP